MPVGSQSYKQCAALRSSKALVSVALSSSRYMNDALLIEPIRMHGARVSALYSRGEARAGAKLPFLLHFEKIISVTIIPVTIAT